MGAAGIICVMVKQPRKGQAKTRLAKTIGDCDAATLAQAFIEDTLVTVREHEECSFVQAVTPDSFCGVSDLPCWPQGDGDLGARIERLAERALRTAPWVLFLGTDSPNLPKQFLAKIVAILSAPAAPDAVLGPTEDGGYYALGLCKNVSLAQVEWSSPTTCADTWKALERAGLSCQLVDPWFDVDEFEDLERLRVQLRHDPLGAPHTAEVLRSSCRTPPR